MWRGSGLAAAVLLTAAGSLAADDLSDEFRYAFEKVYRPGRTFAVLVADDIPTASVYGIDGDQLEAHYSIDVRDGVWEPSSGQGAAKRAVDVLGRGELLELASINYEKNRVELRMVSLETHKVTRGDWLSQETRREPVATNFRFVLPFPGSHTLTEADLPVVQADIARFLRVFRDEAAAELWSAELRLARAGFVPNRSPAVSAGAVKKGMTPLQVIDLLGRPLGEVSFEGRARWNYPDRTVIFRHGRVADVRF